MMLFLSSYNPRISLLLPWEEEGNWRVYYRLQLWRDSFLEKELLKIKYNDLEEQAAEFYSWRNGEVYFEIKHPQYGWRMFYLKTEGWASLHIRVTLSSQEVCHNITFVPLSLFPLSLKEMCSPSFCPLSPNARVTLSLDSCFLIMLTFLGRSPSPWH